MPSQNDLKLTDKATTRTLLKTHISFSLLPIFLQLVAKPGQEAELVERRRNSSISANIIHKIVEYARLSDDLFQLLKDPNARAVLSGALEGTLLSPQGAFED